jgi:subfamily B ATP-binding cassette protein MsbA
MKSFRAIFSLLGDYKGSLVWNFFFNILNAIFSLFTFLSVVPFLYVLFEVNQGGSAPISQAKGLWDQFKDQLNGSILEHGKPHVLLLMCLFIVALALLKNTVNYISLLSIARIRTGVSRDLRKKMYQKVLRLQLAFFSNERKGDLISRMTNDLNEIEFSVIGALEALLKSPVLVFFSLITLVLMSWKLTLFAFIFLPVSGYLIARIAKSLKNAAKRSKSNLGDLIALLDESLTGIRVIKVFNAEDHFEKKFDETNEGYSRLMHKLYKREYLASPMSEFISLMVISVLLYVGGTIVFSGEISGELLIGYLVVFSQIIQPAKQFSDAIFKVNKGMASLERIREVLHAEETVLDKSDAVELSTFSERISFEGVSFKYGEEEVLKNVSFNIEKGQTVALVGSSGSGKTTVAMLLARFYDPTSGSINIDGVAITHLKTKSVRAQMGMVTQDALLFNDTVANNIVLSESHTNEKLMEAARVSNSLEFIDELENKFDTNIGDGGMRLSGGQRQRLSIARAIYKNPSILILDEATSALDTQSEKYVQDAISKMMENRTALVIAHRLSTIQQADLILVMQAGEIVQRGTHKELISQEGLYKTLVEMQEL